MARTRRGPSIDSREARFTTLDKRPQPYWTKLSSGLSLGVYWGTKGGTWYVRRKRKPGDPGSGRWQQIRIGACDDYDDPDGKKVLSHKQAVAEAHRLDGREIEERVEEAAQEGYTVAKCFDDYFKWREVEGGNTYIQRCNYRAHIKDVFGDRVVASLRFQEIEDWKNDLADGRSRATCNRVLTDLKAALNRAPRNKVGSRKEWREVRKFKKTDNPRVDYLQAKEAKRLLNACPPDFRNIVRAGLLSGGRYGELCKTQVRDFDGDAGTLRFTETKSGKLRHVPLTDEGVEHFRLWVAGKKSRDPLFTKANGEPWGPVHQARRMRNACAVAKIDPAVGFHALRHSYASLLVLQGVPLKFVSEALGHADSRMVEIHYAHLQKSDAAGKAIRGALPSFGAVDRKVQTL